MALNYGDNYILKIKKGEQEYLIRDSIAEAAINVIQGTAETEGSIAKALADAQAYASGLGVNYDPSGSAAAVQTVVDNLSGTVNSLSGTVNTLSSKTGEDIALDKSTGTSIATYLTNRDEVIAGAFNDLNTALTGANTQIGAVSGTVNSLSGTVNSLSGTVDSLSGTVNGLSSVYDPLGAATEVQNALIGTGSDVTGASTIYGAKNYAKALVDKVLGSDSAAQTITSLQNILNELNDPDNQQGIASTFVDTVKADLAGLTKTVNNKEVHATVKEYVDAKFSEAQSAASGGISDLDAEVTSTDGTNVQVKVTEDDGKITAVNITTDNTVNLTGVNTAIASAINQLNSTPSQTAGADGLALSISQVSGVVTSISGSIAAETYDTYGAAANVQTALVGTNSDVSGANTIYGAKAYTDAAVSGALNALQVSSISGGVLELLA